MEGFIWWISFSGNANFPEIVVIISVHDVLSVTKVVVFELKMSAVNNTKNLAEMLDNTGFGVIATS